MNGNGKAINNKEAEEFTKKIIAELEPTVHDVIKFIADTKLPIGNIHAHDNVKFNATAREVLAILLSRNIRFTDRFFFFKLVLQPFDMIREIVVKSLQESFDKAVDKSFGKSIEEFRLSDLDKILKV